MRKLILAMVTSSVLVALMGLSTAGIFGDVTIPDAGAVYVDSWKQGLVYQAKTQGNGFAATHMYSKMKDYESFNHAHGSGSLDSDLNLVSYERSNKSHPVGWDWVDIDTEFINLKEDVIWVQSPISFAVGTGYYAANPINYDSLLKENTGLKARASLLSMHHEVEYAHALDKDLEIYALSTFNHTYDPDLVGCSPDIWVDGGTDWMKINEDVTNGKIHIGVLEGEGAVLDPKNLKTSGSTYPPIFAAYKTKFNAAEIDEDYWGTYHIERYIQGSSSPFILLVGCDDWLPCCFGGYETMPPIYQRDVGGFGSNCMSFFDCTSCFVAPDQAQFPRVY